MIFIEHRKNKISDLASVQLDHGVEIDLRSDLSSPGSIHLSHDPWQKGDSFEEWLLEFKRLEIRGPIYLNTKEDGLEQRTRELLQKQQIDNFLFLDTTFPTLVKNVTNGLADQFFLRLSSYEDLENSLKFKGQIRWMWVDCFDRKPLSVEILKDAQKCFQLCLVSPELQGGNIHDFDRFLSLTPYFSAICTKFPREWQVRGL